MKKAFLYMVLCLLTVCSCRPSGKHFSATVEIHEGPVLALKQTNKSAQIDLVHHYAKPYILKSVMLLLTGTENLSDITKVSVFQNNKEIGSNVLTIGKKGIIFL